MAQLQRNDSDDDLLAGWSGELEALLYSPEVEEAIKEVSTGNDIIIEQVSPSLSLSLVLIARCTPAPILSTRKTSIQLITSMSCFQVNRFDIQQNICFEKG